MCVFVWLFFVSVCVCVYSYMCLHSMVVWALASWDISLKSVSTLTFFSFLLIPMFCFLFNGSLIALGHFIPVCSNRRCFLLYVRVSVCSNNVWKPCRVIPVCCLPSYLFMGLWTSVELWKTNVKYSCYDVRDRLLYPELCRFKTGVCYDCFPLKLDCINQGILFHAKPMLE